MESYWKRKAREAQRRELGDADQVAEQADLYEVHHITFVLELFMMLTMYDEFVGPGC